jgi:hypothetical protein
MVRLLVALFLILLLSLSASAQTILIEAESYVAANDVGGVVIYKTSCSGASGGIAVEGFDYPGDWIEVILDVGENGSFEDFLRSGGYASTESDVQATIFGGGIMGEDLVSPFHTIGMGIG